LRNKLFVAVGLLVVTVGVVALALPTILHKAGLHPEYTGVEIELPPGKRALVITTSHGVLAEPGETEGPATGVMASEMTHPYYSFLDAGMDVDVASIKGGEIPIDPQTLNYVIRTAEDERFLADPAFLAKVQNSIKIDDVDFTQYDIVFLAGLGSLHDTATFVKALGWSVVVWVNLSVSIWLGLLAFDITGPGLTGSIFLQSVIAFAVAAPSSPGFFGVFEAAARLGLGVYDVPVTDMVSFATSYHILTFLPVTLMGLWFIRHFGLSWSEMGHSEEIVEAAVNDE